MHRVLVIGNVSVDHLMKVNKFPVTGETKLASMLEINPGGKGANQAVSIARAGARASLIGAVGKDKKGQFLRKQCLSKGINCDYLKEITTQATGISFILLDSCGSNKIVSYSGANQLLAFDEKEKVKVAELVRQCQAVVAHAELPRQALNHIYKAANKTNIPVFLTPMPPGNVAKEQLDMIDVIIPNQAEIEELTEKSAETIEQSMEACYELISRGSKAVVLTMGDKGALLCDKNCTYHAPPYPVNSVDTSGAGDSFTGYLVFYTLQHLGIGNCITEALKLALPYACAAGALAAEKFGTFIAVPDRKRVLKLVNGNSPWKIKQIK